MGRCTPMPSGLACFGIEWQVIGVFNTIVGSYALIWMNVILYTFDLQSVKVSQYSDYSCESVASCLPDVMYGLQTLSLLVTEGSAGKR